jgi:hypothetical protein
MAAREAGSMLTVNKIKNFTIYNNTPIHTCKQHLPTLDGFARACARSLHQRPFLGQEEVILGLVHQVATRFVALDEQVSAHRPHQELRAHQGQAYML